MKREYMNAEFIVYVLSDLREACLESRTLKALILGTTKLQK